MISVSEHHFLRSDDFAAIVTPARGVPTATSRPDEIVVWRLATRKLLVDTEAGVICKADGISRAEYPQPDGSGTVYLGRIWGRVRMAPAHRVVWIAKHGPIRGNYRIVQLNGLRWDNRLANLDIVSHSMAMRSAHSSAYIGPDVNGTDDRPEMHPYVTGSVVAVKDCRTRAGIG